MKTIKCNSYLTQILAMKVSFGLEQGTINTRLIRVW